MKTSFKTIALAIAFSAVFGFNSFADDLEAKKTSNFGTGIFASKSGKIHISLDKYTNDNTVVLVTDQSGKLMYREVVGKDVTKFRKTLNVSELPAGTYQIEIAGKGEKQVKTFEVSEKKAEREISVK
ncbi:T9SS type A sorting domain-containing protein [Dyadobacter arcticus]|uniref:Ribosomal protein S11 n=1 Tax=Dyadobacter arcticus TaxID=1078754 RepID=A0ABX0UNE9_9BACT|nr:T9SS type A sorting domain-containing protein [Dyadobacter arcticus]NIJ53215.1 ribosomal protein S11 [Dyadobacter arcticus]